MRKKIILAVVIIAMLSVSIVFATGILRFDAYESKAKIYFNNEEISFNLPVVTINDNTYIPLREASEKANVDVAWNGEEEKILLTKESQKLDDKTMLDNLFEIPLPDSAKLLNYYYSFDNGEKISKAKISFEEQDLETTISYFSGWIENGDLYYLSLYNEDCPWWDLSDDNEMVCSYYCYKTGLRVKSIPVCVYITEGENGQYYLYAING